MIDFTSRLLMLRLVASFHVFTNVEQISLTAFVKKKFKQEEENKSIEYSGNTVFNCVFVRHWLTFYVKSKKYTIDIRSCIEPGVYP